MCDLGLSSLVKKMMISQMQFLLLEVKVMRVGSDTSCNPFNQEILQLVWPNPTRFFNFGHKIRDESGRVNPQGQKTGPIWSDWPQIGFKIGLNDIMFPIKSI